MCLCGNHSTIGRGAFQYCTGLETVTIPGSVKVIYDETFSGCTSLTSVTIPASVTTIDNSAFSGCTSLSQLNIKTTSLTSDTSLSLSYLTSGTTVMIPEGFKINGVEITIGDTGNASNYFGGANVVFPPPTPATPTAPTSAPAPSPSPASSPSPSYEFQPKSELEWTKGSGKNMTVVIKNAGDDSQTFEKFKALYVGGDKVDASHYTTEKGSLILTLKADYLETLRGGSHIMRVRFTDGDVTADFTVRVKSGGTTYNSPYTGEGDGMIAANVVLLAIVAAGAAYGLRKRHGSQSL
ncbi:MAG: leucine-rich repeat domain-containing protein [Clostridia bacterium]|nr:leucine-rich repeat domain-containing protein [Clostridia bacterium]